MKLNPGCIPCCRDTPACRSVLCLQEDPPPQGPSGEIYPELPCCIQLTISGMDTTGDCACCNCSYFCTSWWVSYGQIDQSIPVPMGTDTSWQGGLYDEERLNGETHPCGYRFQGGIIPTHSVLVLHLYLDDDDHYKLQAVIVPDITFELDLGEDPPNCMELVGLTLPHIETTSINSCSGGQIEITDVKYWDDIYGEDGEECAVLPALSDSDGTQRNFCGCDPQLPQSMEVVIPDGWTPQVFFEDCEDRGYTAPTGTIILDLDGVTLGGTPRYRYYFTEDPCNVGCQFCYIEASISYIALITGGGTNHFWFRPVINICSGAEWDGISPELVEWDCTMGYTSQNYTYRVPPCPNPLAICPNNWIWDGSPITGRMLQ